MSAGRASNPGSGCRREQARPRARRAGCEQPTRTCRGSLAVLLWLALVPMANAEPVLEIISLRHSIAESLVPTLRELVSPGGTVTGMGEKLIIRTDPANLAQLKTVLESLDRRLRQLRITVSQDSGADTVGRDEQLAARVRSGDVAAAVGGPTMGPGARIDVQGEHAGLSYRNYATRGRDDRAHTHFVTTVEGQPAFINLGQVVPLANRQVVSQPYGAAVFDSIEYRNVGRGFYVTPRVAGESVTLEISPYTERLAAQGGGVIDSRGVNTVVSGRIGEWIALGGASESATIERRDGLSSTRRAGGETYDVWVKVDIAE